MPLHVMLPASTFKEAVSNLVAKPEDKSKLRYFLVYPGPQLGLGCDAVKKTLLQEINRVLYRCPNEKLELALWSIGKPD